MRLSLTQRSSVRFHLIFQTIDGCHELLILKDVLLRDLFDSRTHNASLVVSKSLGSVVVVGSQIDALLGFKAFAWR